MHYRHLLEALLAGGGPAKFAGGGSDGIGKLISRGVGSVMQPVNPLSSLWV